MALEEFEQRVKKMERIYSIEIPNLRARIEGLECTVLELSFRITRKDKGAMAKIRKALKALGKLEGENGKSESE